MFHRGMGPRGMRSGMRPPFGSRGGPFDGPEREFFREGRRDVFDDGRGPLPLGRGPPFDMDRPPFDMDRPPFDMERLDRPPFDMDRPPYDMERPPFDIERPPFDMDRQPGIDRGPPVRGPGGMPPPLMATPIMNLDAPWRNDGGPDHGRHRMEEDVGMEGPDEMPKIDESKAHDREDRKDDKDNRKRENKRSR